MILSHTDKKDVSLRLALHPKHLVFLVWVALLVAGFWKVLVFTNTPGVSASASISWPQGSKLNHDPELPTLVVFVHPECPCSKATLGELERLMPHIKDKMTIHVVKNNEAEAKRFGALTSGQVFLYDAHRDLIFQGGITASRGHMGDSRGREAILSFVESGKASISKTSVFGCSLKNPERAPAGTKQ